MLNQRNGLKLSKQNIIATIEKFKKEQGNLIFEKKCYDMIRVSNEISTVFNNWLKGNKMHEYN